MYLTFYLASFLAYILAIYLASILTFSLTSIQAFIMAFSLACVLARRPAKHPEGMLTWLMNIIHHNHSILITEGSLEVKLPTIWTVGKAEVGRVRGEKRRREKIREEKE